MLIHEGPSGTRLCTKAPPRPLLIIAIRYARERRKFDMGETCLRARFPHGAKQMFSTRYRTLTLYSFIGQFHALLGNLFHNYFEHLN